MSKQALGNVLAGVAFLMSCGGMEDLANSCATGTVEACPDRSSRMPRSNDDLTNSLSSAAPGDGSAAAARSREDGVFAGKLSTRRRRNRTYQATGYAALPVLKTGSPTRELPPHGSC